MAEFELCQKGFPLFKLPLGRLALWHVQRPGLAGCSAFGLSFHVEGNVASFTHRHPILFESRSMPGTVAKLHATVFALPVMFTSAGEAVQLVIRHVVNGPGAENVTKARAKVTEESPGGCTVAAFGRLHTVRDVCPVGAPSALVLVATSCATCTDGSGVGALLPYHHERVMNLSLRPVPS